MHPITVTTVYANTAPQAVYVGRTPRYGGPSLLHNRWSFKDGTAAQFKVATLEECLARFRRFLGDCVLYKHPNAFERANVNVELVRLAQIATQRPLTLTCHCSTPERPAPCHAHIIASAIEWVATKSGWLGDKS